ncbi:MAG: bifunctional [glutamate--ammonia ligase]-adenylyl-L-tyrosine phosphorylase/[glutamate--ammonia-ligase] adenylyltransferase [Rhodanobacteraceae bacterium]
MTANAQLELDAWLDERWDTLCQRAAAQGVSVVDDAQALACWRKVLLASDFGFDVLRRQPELLAASAWQTFRDDDAALAQRINEAVHGIDDEAVFMAALRRVRQREALRLILRSVNAIDDVAATLHATTDLYVALLRSALDFAGKTLRERHGVARSGDGEAQQLVVVGMGKLGGGELNFSSDIDLILAYAEPGQSDGGRPLDNEDYFVRLGRKLVHLLAHPGPDGIVARVDLRLRPFGQAGRLALPFAAMEHYYQREGRDWERYAWIKAAPVAGDTAAGEQLLDLLRPFVYRKYLDYGAFAGLRKLKALIADQVARKDLSDNLKHGPGGIREVEFCVQLIQMIRGGREPALRVRGLLPALAACADRGFMDADSARRLRQAYLFLRAAENAVQMLADQQTHDIPDDARARRRVALSLGFEDWPAMADELQAQREFVQTTFADLLLPHAEGDEPQGDDRDVGLWQAARQNALEADRVADLGFQPGEQGRRALLSVARSAPVRMMSARSAERLDRLMPHLIGAARKTPFPAACLERLASLVQAVARRSSYLTLLEEQPAARQHLAELFADSAFLAERVIEQPILLDDVLDPRMDQLPLKRHAIADEISHALDSLDERHSEADLERLNETRASLAFRLGLAFRDGQASAPAIARRLAALAEAVVDEVLDLARRELIARHGSLPASETGDGFAVIAYGSLGGSELGFASDLDLVFLYDESRMGQSSDGERPLEAVRWYQRLAQRVVHWLTSPQRGGRLYEVDTRLRPDGSKGMLVSSLDGFVDYQQNRAWIWEHQALVRARPVAGDAMLMQRFGQWRDVVLARQRDPAQVSLEVSRMRQRWRRERDRSDADRIDLKQGHGALLDLEFLLQILVLSHAHSHPGLLVSGNTGHLIKAAADAGLLSPEQSQLLDQAHGALLACALRCAMDKRPRVARREPELQRHLDLIARLAYEHGLDPNPPSDP